MPDAPMQHEAWSHMQRRPLTDFVRTPTRSWSPMSFLRSPRISLLDALLRWSVFSLMVGTACSCALAQQWSVSPVMAPRDDSQAMSFVSELLGKMTLEEKLGQ